MTDSTGTTGAIVTAVGGNSPIVSKEALQASSGGILGIEGLPAGTTRVRGSKSKVK